uniref:Uncharacterized protein n=1 Tax=Anguilla anguilla TaxID=7936 RepID=A0A0E9UF71_ANGAN
MSSRYRRAQLTQSTTRLSQSRHVWRNDCGNSYKFLNVSLRAS